MKSTRELLLRGSVYFVLTVWSFILAEIYYEAGETLPQLICLSIFAVTVLVFLKPAADLFLLQTCFRELISTSKGEEKVTFKAWWDERQAFKKMPVSSDGPRTWYRGHPWPRVLVNKPNDLPTGQGGPMNLKDFSYRQVMSLANQWLVAFMQVIIDHFYGVRNAYGINQLGYKQATSKILAFTNLQQAFGVCATQEDFQKVFCDLLEGKYAPKGVKEIAAPPCTKVIMTVNGFMLRLPGHALTTAEYSRQAIEILQAKLELQIKIKVKEAENQSDRAEKDKRWVTVQRLAKLRTYLDRPNMAIAFVIDYVYDTYSMSKNYMQDKLGHYNSHDLLAAILIQLVIDLKCERG